MQISVQYFSSSSYMPIFILVGKVVLLVCKKSALIMSFPARKINKTPLNLLALTFSKHLADIWNFNCSRISHRYLDADFKFQVSLPLLLGNNTKAFDSFGRNYHQS